MGLPFTRSLYSSGKGRDCGMDQILKNGNETSSTSTLGALTPLS